MDVGKHAYVHGIAFGFISIFVLYRGKVALQSSR